MVAPPNPFTHQTPLFIQGIDLKKANLSLYNAMGKMVRQQVFSGNQVVLSRNELPAGLYYYTIDQDNEVLASGSRQK